MNASEKIMKNKTKFSDFLRSKDLSSPESIYVTAAIIIAVLCVGSLFFKQPHRIVLGLLLGLLFSILCFRLLKSAVETSLTLPQRKVAGYMQSRYMIRFFIKGVALYIGFTNELFNGLAVLCGLLSTAWAIHLLNLINIKISNKE